MKQGMDYRRTIIIAAIIVGIGALVLLFSISLAGKASLTGESGGARLNRPAENFTLPLFDGGELTLSELKGKPVVINFWASWCGPCREEADVLEAGWGKYKDKGVVFIGVNIQDAEADARSFMKEFGVSYPNGPDKDGRITIDYGVGGIPVTFFVDRNGVTVSRWVGAITEDMLTARIEEMLR